MAGSESVLTNTRRSIRLRTKIPPWGRTDRVSASSAVSRLKSARLSSAFVIDNRILILKDPRLRSVSLENLHLIFTKEAWWPTGSTGVYRPLATLSYLFNYSILGSGESPVSYHVLNFLLQWL